MNSVIIVPIKGNYNWLTNSAQKVRTLLRVVINDLSIFVLLALADGIRLDDAIYGRMLTTDELMRKQNSHKVDPRKVGLTPDKQIEFLRAALTRVSVVVNK